MSFGSSTSDIILVVQLAWRTVQSARKACGHYNDLTLEVAGLHNALQRLQREVEQSESPLNRAGDSCRDDLRPILTGRDRTS